MMNVRIQSTKNFGLANGVKMIVYSPAGYGKTKLVATCPTPIILSSESGLLSLADFELPYIEIKTLPDLRDAYLWSKSSSEARQFETLCLDSISDIAEVVLTAAKSGKKDGRMAYGEMIDDMNKELRAFRDIPGFNVYMSAKQERIKDEGTGIVSNGPMMPGNKLSQNVPYFPDEVFRLGIEGVGENSYRYLQCQPDFVNTAKDRSGKLNMIEEPHLGKIIAKIRGQAYAGA